MAHAAAAPGSSAGRVVAGSARGIRLVGPGEGTRPLGDRLKQSLFAILEPRVRDRVFVDLYAGSGAAGIEALSRGAARAIFVERDARALESIARNLAATSLAARAAVVRRDANDWLGDARRRELAAGPAAIVFLDPPYESANELDASLATLDREGPDGVVARGGIVVAKHFHRTGPSPTRLLRSVRQERFGDTILTFYRWLDEVDA
jgi:16S rRNA (guanine966-N2)-methyltransferase